MTHLRSLPLILCLLVLALVAGPSSTNAVTLDGVLADREWDEAVRESLEGGGEVLVQTEHGRLLVAMSADGEGWGHLYLAADDTVYVLHVSAALGTAIYEKQGDGSWTRSQQFEWAVGGTGHSEEEEAERTAHLEQHGWVGSTVRMGDAGVLEFAVDLAAFPKYLRWAVVFAEEADSRRYWPATLADDTLDRQLLFGDAPESLGFEPETWAPAPASLGLSAADELKRLYEADQADRQGNMHEADWAAISQRDAERRERVTAIVSSGGARTAADFFHAAMVFQHGEGVEAIRQARDWAQKATELADVDEPVHSRAKWLYAAATDRHLHRQGMPQIYGTQLVRHEGGPWTLEPFDRDAVSDEERAAHGVRPVAEQEAKAERMNEELRRRGLLRDQNSESVGDAGDS